MTASAMKNSTPGISRKMTKDSSRIFRMSPHRGSVSPAKGRPGELRLTVHSGTINMKMKNGLPKQPGDDH